MIALNRREFLVALSGAFFLSARSVTLGSQEREAWRKKRAGILQAMQQVMGQLPPAPTKPIEVSILESEELPSFNRLKITFSSEPGDNVPAYLMVPKNIKGQAPAVLCLHQTTGFGKREPAGVEGDPTLQYAKQLTERGFVCIVPDYPFLGENHFDPYTHGYESCTMKGIFNHMRAVDVLHSLSYVDTQNIGVIGHSLGGHNALFVAAFDERIKAIVTSCGFTSFQKYKKGDLTGWSGQRYMPSIASRYNNAANNMPFDFSDVLSALAPRPIFISAPKGDDNFDVTGVEDCVALAKPVYKNVFRKKKRFEVVYPNAEHEFPENIRMEAYAFLNKWLK